MLKWDVFMLTFENRLKKKRNYMDFCIFLRGIWVRILAEPSLLKKM